MTIDDDGTYARLMAQGPEPTGWELLRTMDGLRQTMEGGFRDVNNRLADSFIGRREYDADHDATADDIKDLKDHNRDQDAFRRAVILAMVVIFFTAVSSLLVTIVHIHG